MANHYLTSGSCKDFMFAYSNGGSEAVSLDFKDISGANAITAGSIPLVAAKPFAGAWNHDIATSTSLSGSVYFFDAAGVLVGDSPANDFSVQYAGNIENFYVTQAPASPDSINGDKCLVIVSERVPAVGATVTYTLYARDQYNRFKSVGGDNITASISSGDATVSAVTDNGNGSYSVDVSKPTSGWANVQFALDGAAIYPFFFQDSEFGGASGDSLDVSRCTITVTPGFIDVGVFSRSNGVPYGSDADLVQVFSPTITDIGPGVWDNANNVRFTIPAGTTGGHLLYCYAGSNGREVAAGSMQTYQLDGGVAAIQPRDIALTMVVLEAIQPRDIKLTHRAIGPIQPRDLSVTHRVRDPATSMPSAGSGGGVQGSGWPSRVRFWV